MSSLSNKNSIPLGLTQILNFSRTLTMAHKKTIQNYFFPMIMTTISGENDPRDEKTKQCGRGEEKVSSIALKYADLLKPKTYVHENIRVPQSLLV